jgi:homoserine dehydrogenase/aspartate/methionine/tyrosine aminotransferase
MPLEPFAMERLQSMWEHRVDWNVSESGVQPLRLADLLTDAAELDALLGQELGYTQTNGTEPLRALVAGMYPGATPEHLVITNGGSEANCISLLHLVRPGDEVVLMTPNYMQAPGLTRGLQGRIRPWPLVRDERAGRWRPDLDALPALLSERTRAILICNPNNPTGARLTAGELDAIGRIASQAGVWVISDEIYRGAERDGRETPSMWGRASHVLITSGLSKAYGLPGLRIGWVAGPPEVVEQLWGVHDYTSIAPGALSDRLARMALQPQMRTQLLDRTRRILNANYPILRAWIDARSPCATSTASARPRSPTVSGSNRACSSCRGITSRWTASCGSASATIRSGWGRASAASVRCSTRWSRQRMLAEVALVGFGNVARRFVRLVQEHSDRLAGDHDLTVRIVAIATRRHGTVLAPEGLDGVAAAALVDEGRRLEALAPAGASIAHDSFSAISFLGTRPAALRVVVETTTLQIEDGRPARDHVAAAIDAGCDVVTANKGPAAFAYAELADRARQAGVSFLFEGAVMDGVPIFNLVRETLPAVRILGFRGIVNSTTNHILTALEEGGAYEPALARMQADGIAEADPSLDVDGWDAAAKTAALANVWLDARITPYDVDRSGIGPAAAAAARDARARGHALRLVASAARGARPSVRLMELPAGDLLAGMRGMSNALEIETDLLGRIAITQLDGGLTQTAYALLSDLITIRRRSPHAAPPRRSP